MSARPSDLLRLRAVVAHADDLLDTVEHFGLTGERYVSPADAFDRVLKAAVDQYVTQICEEAREVTDETRARMAGVPWDSVAEMRNYLVHAYGSLKADQVRDTIAGGELAELRDACAACADENERGDYAPAHTSRTAERRAAGCDG